MSSAATCARPRLALLCLAFLALAPARARGDGGHVRELEEQGARLAGAILVGGRAMSYLRELADGIGPRLSGSRAYARAVEWALDTFHKNGITDVTAESFVLPHGWERGTAQGRLLSPLERSLHVSSLGWSPAMPRGGVRGPVAVLSDFSPDTLRGRAAGLRGHVVLLDEEASLSRHGRDEVLGQVGRAYQVLADAGVLAVLHVSLLSDNSLGDRRYIFHRELVGPLPGLSIGLEDARLIERLLERGPVEVDLRSASAISGPVPIKNVVAEIPGRERPGEWVLVSAHLDSWDAGTGAADNGVGVAEVLEAARAIQALGRRPSRSIRFALFGGEEQGRLGSKAFVRAHRSELDACAAAVNTDGGNGAPRGWKLQGREDLASAMQPIAAGLLANLGTDRLSLAVQWQSDHYALLTQGVPALNLMIDEADDYSHLSADTLDKIEPRNVAVGAAAVALTAYALADWPARIARRLTQEEVAAVLQRAGLAEILREAGEWSPPAAKHAALLREPRPARRREER